MIYQTELFSPQLNRRIPLRIYTPPGYEESDKAYPVAYFFDGQNLFRKEDSSYGMIWAVDQALEQLNYPMIVVGLDSGEHPQRMNEYSPWIVQPPIESKELLGLGGQGENTAQFLVDTLIPWIDAKYQTSSTRLIAGSSLGGVMSLYAGLTYPEVFTEILAMSTASWVFGREFEAFLSTCATTNQRIYVDVGTKESKEEGFSRHYLDANQRIHDLLEKAEADFRYVIEDGARHNETAWAKRLPEALAWLYDLKGEKDESSRQDF